MNDYDLTPITEEFEVFLVDKVKNVHTKYYEASNISSIKKNELETFISLNAWTKEWLKEFEGSQKRIYKHYIKSKPQKISGLLSLSRIENKFIVHKCQLAPEFYKKEKPYNGVFENLLVHLCRMLTLGGDYIIFLSTKEVISNYKRKIPLKIINEDTVIIDFKCALQIVNAAYENKKI